MTTGDTGGRGWGYGISGEGAEQWISASVPGQPWDFYVQMAWIDSRPQIVSLRIEARGDDAKANRATITTEKLRRLPLRQIRQMAHAGLHLDLGALQRVVGAKRRPGQPYEPGHHEEVAETYRKALAAGQAPRAAIERKWDVSRATASKWIRTAREERLLGWPEGVGVAGDSRARRKPTTPPRRSRSSGTATRAR